jgi:hypothetical protein
VEGEQVVDRRLSVADRAGEGLALCTAKRVPVSAE